MNKFIVLMKLSLSIMCVSDAQSAYFESEGDVINYLDGKTFYNSDYGMHKEYGYISAFTSYGISVTNKNGAHFNFINVYITTYGSFADLIGMCLDNGDNFGFRLYSGKTDCG